MESIAGCRGPEIKGIEGDLIAGDALTGDGIQISEGLVLWNVCSDHIRRDPASTFDYTHRTWM